MSLAPASYLPFQRVLRRDPADLRSPGDHLREPWCLPPVDVHVAVDAAVQPEEP